MIEAPATTPLVAVDNLEMHYPVAASLPWSPPKNFVRAVDGLSFALGTGETLSIVGESGCGKTTTAKLVLRLEEPTGGTVSFKGKDLRALDTEELAAYHRSVQAVFQNPFSSMNPRMRVWEIVGEPRIINGNSPKPELHAEVEELLVAVGLQPGAARAFPHELSGGMRQRVALARALILKPALIVLDEPVSALDVSVRAQIMNLLKDVQERLGVAYLLIAHDLATTRYLSHRIAVMYLGQIVETAPSRSLIAGPLHPYTQALIAAARPEPKWLRQPSTPLSGEVPSPIDPPKGCRFHPRCPVAFDRCSTEIPELREIAPDHKVACHLY